MGPFIPCALSLLPDSVMAKVIPPLVPFPFGNVGASREEQPFGI